MDNNNNPICLVCNTNKFIPNEANKCLICPNGCSQCDYDLISKKIFCINCKSSYVLDPETKLCKYCKSISETGEGCNTCIFNISSERYECRTCSGQGHYDDSNKYYYDYEYAYIKNTLQCISNMNQKTTGLYGCLTAEYIQSTGKYECLSCKNYIENYFIPVITDKSCIKPISEGLTSDCLEAEKIGNQYSCRKCIKYKILVKDVSTNIKQCYEMENELSYCLEGKLENGNLICTKCVNNSYLINNICSCNHDSFSKDSKWCYKCNDPKHGNPGCEESEGCEYILDNDQLNCNKCKDGYFSYTEGQCFLCSSIIPNCNKCHYDVTNEKLICDSCISDIYILNTEENICQLNDCEEYPEISPGCIICKDKLNEYKEIKKCQRCKYGYFKTKDEKCVYCRSEQFGGPGCDECGYEKNENGIETDNIICKECYPFYPYLKLNSGYSYIYNDKYYDYYSFSFRHYYYGYRNQNISYNSKFLSPKGKCYDCKILFSDACEQCNFIKNSEGIENLKCTACSIGYYLTPEGNCVNITSIIKKNTTLCRTSIFFRRHKTLYVY